VFDRVRVHSYFTLYGIGLFGNGTKI
jgi:hypothetical protein